MPINFGEIFTGKGKKLNQTPESVETVNKSLDSKDNITVNMPKQYAPFISYSPPSKGEIDNADQTRRMPWNTIPFLKPFQFPKENSLDGHQKGEVSTGSQFQKLGTDAFHWTTTTKVKQKKKELNLFSPSSF